MDFARGAVLLRVGKNDYIADVVVGTRRSGVMVLYDILNLKATSFTKKETNTAISTNPSPGAARSTALVSTDSIPQEGGNIKGQFSLEMAESQAEKGQKNTAQEGGEVRFSIKYDQNNTPYVVIEKDILAGVSQDKWVKAVKDNLREQFPDGVSVGNNVVAINQRSRLEMTFSSYMHRLFKLEPQMYADKLRATANADEILRATRNWINEALLHPRKDAIIDFARGEVLIRIGRNDYSAQVIVGNRGESGLILYDIINLARTTIQERNEKTGADRFITKAQGGPSDSQSAPAADSITNTEEEVKGQFSLKNPVEEANELPLSKEELAGVQGIGRKSVSAFNAKDIAATESLAKRYWNEMGVKSPFFRAWFGDWRADDRETAVAVANVKGEARGIQKNEDTGWHINVSGKVFNETKSHSSLQNRRATPYLPYINDIVKKAVLLDSHAIGKSKSANSVLMHSMYALADMGDGPELLKLYVEEMNDPNSSATAKRAYQLQNIEKTSAASVRVQGKTLSSLTNTADDIKTISDLFAYVKERDASFAPKESSKVVDENGLPLVMYHGTRMENGEFYEFDASKAAKKGGLGLKALGKGNYFTSKRLDGTERYGSRVIEAYLNIKRPIEVELGRTMAESAAKALGHSVEGIGSDELQNALRRAGYDGVISYTKDGGVGIAESILNESLESNNELYRTYHEMRQYLRETKLKVPRGIWGLVKSNFTYSGLSGWLCFVLGGKGIFDKSGFVTESIYITGGL